jgi:type II secretory pathway component GspD/PulD (secretin)
MEREGEFMRILMIVFALVVAARAADEDKPEVRIQVTKDMELQAFLDMVSQSTGSPILYNPMSQRIRAQKMGSTFSLSVPKDRLFDTFRAILSFYELTLVPIGPKGYEIFLVIDSRSTNNFVKNKAIPVKHEELPQFADRDGLYISCAIPVRHVDNLTTLRTALSTMVSPAGIGRVHEVPGTKTIIVMDFAPTVAAIATLIREMDKPNTDEEVLESIELTHANAKDVAASIQELYATPASNSQQNSRRGVVVVKPRPRLVAFPARNAVLVRASQSDLETIRGLITKLDQAKGQRGAYVMVAVKHVEADYLAQVLMLTLEGPATDDWEISIVAETHTNSLLLNGDKNAIAAVQSMIERIDREKPK